MRPSPCLLAAVGFALLTTTACSDESDLAVEVGPGGSDGGWGGDPVGATGGGSGGESPAGGGGGLPWPVGGGASVGGAPAQCEHGYDDTGWFGTVPDLAVSPEGSIYLSFVADGQVQLAELGQGAETVPESWGASVRFRKPRIAWGADAVHLVWGSSEQELQYARRSSTGWDREHVTTVDALFSVPQIAATPDGSAHVLYQWCHTNECPKSPSAYWHRSGAGTWTGPEVLSGMESEWRDDALVADDQGRVHGVWKGAYQPGQTRRRTAAGAWEAVAEIQPSTDGGSISFGDITMGPDGVPHHAFFEFGTLGIGYSRGKAGGQWHPSELVSEAGLDESYDYDMRPGIAVSPAGVVTIVWAQWAPDLERPGAIMVCQGTAGSWGCGPLADDSGVTAGGKPAVVFAGGAFHVVWRGTAGQLTRFHVSCPHY